MGYFAHFKNFPYAICDTIWMVKRIHIHRLNCKTFRTFVAQHHLWDCLQSTDKSKLNCFCCWCDADCLNPFFSLHVELLLSINSIDALIETSQHSFFACSFFIVIIYHSSTMVRARAALECLGTHRCANARVHTDTHTHSKENAINIRTVFLILHTKYMCLGDAIPCKRI